jgi:ADP-heptose:LPS heptosyltransferase
MTSLSRLAQPSVAPLSERFESVARIAVLRGGGLGDLLFAVPAVEALAAAYPRAGITLLGSPVHEQIIRDRLSVDIRFEPVPVAPGIRDGESDPDLVEAFFARNAGTFDLAVQLHGGGRFSNPFLLRLLAAHSIGCATADAEPLERTIPYLYYQHEALRALEVVGLAGVGPVMLEARLSVTDEDRAAGDLALDLLGDPGDAPVAVVHPGATDPRRRWPAGCFAALAVRLTGEGFRVVIVGDGPDVELASHIADTATRGSGAVVSLAGRLSIPALMGILASATVFVGNDSGPRHLAQAVGVPTVGIYWFGNLINAGPLGRERHRVQLGWTTVCPVCGRDATQVGWSAERCEHDVSFVADVSIDSVFEDAMSLTARTVPARGR